MSSTKRYNYTPEDYASYVEKPKTLKVIPRRKKKKKVSFSKLALLLLFACLVFFPVTKNLYNYTVLNRIHNSKIVFDANVPAIYTHIVAFPIVLCK